MDLPPEQWEHDKGYVDGRRKMERLKVVNDEAESGVAMVTTFNDSLTKDEQRYYYSRLLFFGFLLSLGLPTNYDIRND